MPGQWVVVASSEAWPEAGAQAERALNTGWILDNASFSSTGGVVSAAGPSTAVAFLSTGDGTTGSGNGFYALYRKLRVVHAGGTSYCRVLTAAYSTTTTQTTVTVTDFQSGSTSLSTGTMTSVAAAALFYGSSGATPQEAGLRATGDMLYRDSTGVTRLAVGTSGQALYGGTVPQWASAPSPLALISETVLSTAAAQVAFSGISTAYTHLFMVGALATTDATDSLLVRLNSDTGANYGDENIQGTGGGVSAANETTGQTRAFMGVCGSTLGGGIQLWIYNYARQTLPKGMYAQTSSWFSRLWHHAGWWQGSTQSVNAVTLYVNSGNNFQPGSELSLYGLSS